MHYAEHLTTKLCSSVRVWENVWVCSNCVSATTKDNVHRVQTICTRPVQLVCMESKECTRVSQLKKKKLFWACGQHTHEKKNPLKNLSEKRIVRGKSHMKSNTPEATQSSSWAWLLGLLSSPGSSFLHMWKTRHPIIRDWYMQTGTSGIEPHLLCFVWH